MRHEIDNHSGVGTQFQVIDVNGDGLLDIAVASTRAAFMWSSKAAIERQAVRADVHATPLLALRAPNPEPAALARECIFACKCRDLRIPPEHDRRVLAAEAVGAAHGRVDFRATNCRRRVELSPVRAINRIHGRA